MLHHSQERARSPFHKKIEFFCGTGILPVPDISARRLNFFVEQASCLFLTLVQDVK
ncbi:hypothetical protein QUB30_06340 [Microcoleus sp. BROC3]